MSTDYFEEQESDNAAWEAAKKLEWENSCRLNWLDSNGDV